MVLNALGIVLLIAGSPLDNAERWACARSVLKRYGVDAAAEVDRRVALMKERRDDAGHATWFNIGLCLIALQERDGAGAVH